METLRIAICDDDFLVCGVIEEMLLSYTNFKIIFDIYNDSLRLSKFINSNTDYYNLYILDIEMPNQTGIELANNIRKRSLFSHLVFLTNYKEYMSEVFQLHTFDYLLKPIKKETLYTLIDRVCTFFNLSKTIITFLQHGVTYSLELSTVQFIEKKGRYAIIHVHNNSEFSIISSTKNILARLNNQFIQVHTSYIVNISYIRGIKYGKVILENNVNEFLEVPISRKFQKLAKEKISAYLSSRFYYE